MPENCSFHFPLLEREKNIRVVTSRPLPAGFSPSNFDVESEFLPFLSPENVFWLRKEGFDAGRLVLAEQIHGAGVIRVKAPGLVRGVDALFTEKAGLPLAIRTADCPAVMVLFPEVPAVGIAHSGWRGARDNIVGNLIKTMLNCWPVSPNSIKVAVSPFIRSCCYQVGDEFSAYFLPECFIRRDGRLFLDLGKVILDQITSLGISAERIFLSPQCTYCSEPPLYSFRRQRTTRRLLTVISILE